MAIGKQHVFVSYARADTQSIAPIIQSLRSEGLEFWLDQEGIEGATFWRKEIVDAITECSAVLLLETRFRRNDWHTGQDFFRAALHTVGIKAYFRADADGRWPFVIAAWKAANGQVNSQVWRKQFTYASNLFGRGSGDFLSRYFRFAQQAWTRAARWEAAFGGSRKSPFLPVVELLEMGVLPIGYDKDYLVLFVLDRGPPSTGAPASDRPRYCVSGSRREIFLSCPLTGDIPWRPWAESLRNVGDHQIGR